VDQGGRENLNFKFRFTFFFVSYILSSFLFFFVGAKLASKNSRSRKKYDLFFVLEVCWISYCTKMAQKMQ